MPSLKDKIVVITGSTRCFGKAVAAELPAQNPLSSQACDAAG